MPSLSITEAARLAGVDRRTIQRQIKRGTLSATAAPDGSRVIDTAELFRVYPDATLPQDSSDTARQMPPDATGQGAAVEALQGQVDTLLSQLAASEARERWLQSQLERSQDKADGYLHQLMELQEQVRLLTGPQDEPERRPWWWRLMGR